MVILFGVFASHSVELQNDLLSYFDDFLPPDAFHLLRTTAIELSANASDGMLTFGIVVALWFASGRVSSMISALNLAYRVRERRPWLKVRAIALALTLPISTFLLVALFIVLAGSHFVEWLGVPTNNSVHIEIVAFAEPPPVVFPSHHADSTFFSARSFPSSRFSASRDSCASPSALGPAAFVPWSQAPSPLV